MSEFSLLTLRFTHEQTEKRYRVDYANRSLNIVRLAMLFGGVQYLLFIFLDLMLGEIITPDQFTSLLVIRVVVFLSILLIIVWSFRKSFRRYMQAGITLVPLIAGLGVVCMILSIQSNEGYNQYYVGVIIIFIYIHVLLRLRFIYATSVSWIIFCSFTSASLYINASGILIINSVFMIFSAQICGMAASYIIEYYDRTVFKQRTALDKRRRELRHERDEKSRELTNMRNIQLTLLPEKPPYHPEYEIAAYISTAAEIGGDYYDFHLSKDGKLTFILADATGHGARAGLMVTAAKILFILYGNRKSLPDTLRRFSEIIKTTGLRKLYISMALGRLSREKLVLSGAGMPEALIWRQITQTVEGISLKGMPVGSVTTYPYQTTEHELNSGDYLFLVSDGLTELRNPDNEMFGYDTPRHILLKYAHLKPQELIDAVSREIDLFRKTAPVNDDITLLAIQKV